LSPDCSAHGSLGVFPRRCRASNRRLEDLRQVI
jgi:hypothetical protein